MLLNISEKPNRNFYLIARGKDVSLTVSFGFVLRGSSPCKLRKSFVRINFENSVTPVPPPGIGILSFMFAEVEKKFNQKVE